MRTGFEVTAAVPKRLREAEDAPASETMRGERKITQAPSTDQKKVRRQMQRRTAVMNDVGDCRLCEGPLEAKSRDGETVKAECRDCGTEHSLQQSQVNKSAAQKFAEFQNLDDRQRAQIEMLAGYMSAEQGNCPSCGTKGFRTQIPYGHAQGTEHGHQTLVRCLHCGHNYKHYDPADNEAHEERRQQKAREHGRTAASHTASLIALVGSTWEIAGDTSPYVHTGMSAIARRAQSVLDTKENS